MPTHYASVKHGLAMGLVGSAERYLDSAVNESIHGAVLVSGFHEAYTQVFHQLLRLFDYGLQELVKEDEEYQLNILCPYVFMSMNAIFSVVDQDLKRNWTEILRYQYVGKMKGAAEIELKPLIEQAEVANIFRVIKKNDNTLSQTGDLVATDGCRDDVGDIKNNISPHRAGLVGSGGPDP
ncbi:unnamed protein product [Rhizoctonia solani]|uniref:Uncharacterized protein n=1 Tax=Rhizoctonia solani TaxID=456999 RepID=A0A8H3CJ90_9AGAM|nr:unnamed protein product [Rhizoctonia solani]